MTIRPLFTPTTPTRSEASNRPVAESSPNATASLSDAEQQALAQQFPESPTLALRLYGPQRGADPVASLGSRLDLRA